MPTGEYIACSLISVFSWPIRSKNVDILSFILGRTDSIWASDVARSRYFSVSMKTLGGISNFWDSLAGFMVDSRREAGMLKVGALGV